MFSIANMPPQLLDPGALLTVTAVEKGPGLSSSFIHVTTSVIGMDGDPIALEGVLCCNSLTLQNMADRDRVQEYWAARPPHVMDVGIRLDDDEELEEHSDEADERVNTDDVDMEEEESSVDYDEVDRAMRIGRQLARPARLLAEMVGPRPTSAPAPTVGGSVSSASALSVSTAKSPAWRPLRSPQPSRSQGLASAAQTVRAVRRPRGHQDVDARRAMGQQWRFTWMGAPDAVAGHARIAENLVHNGGVVVASTVCAPDLGSAVWDSAVHCRLKLPILLLGCESLVHSFEDVATQQWDACDDKDDPTTCSLVAVTVVMHAPSAIPDLGEQIRLMVINVGYMAAEHQRTLAPPKYTAFALARLTATVSAFLVKHKDNLPRIICGDLGPLAPGFVDLAAAALGYHVCWAGNGPTKPGWLDTSGFWLVGSHSHMAGNSIFAKTHVVQDAVSVSMPAPRFSLSDTVLHGTKCASGEPTLYIGRSHRTRGNKRQRKLAVSLVELDVPNAPHS